MSRKTRPLTAKVLRGINSALISGMADMEANFQDPDCRAAYDDIGERLPRGGFSRTKAARTSNARQPVMKPSDLLTLSDAAALNTWGCRDTLSNYVRDGRLPYIVRGTCKLVTVKDLNAMKRPRRGPRSNR